LDVLRQLSPKETLIKLRLEAIFVQEPTLINYFLASANGVKRALIIL